MQLRTGIVLFLLILLGFAVRVYDLEGQSMWSDEGLSLYRAKLPLSEVLANTIIVDGFVTQDTNPPFYFLLINLWRRAAGETVFALRFTGVAVGVLAVPLLYVWAKGIFGRRVGLLAALLMAISPFHVWQSQVLRNYGLLLTLNLLSVYGLFRFALSPQRQWRWLALWGVAGLLGIYTHYFGFFVMAYGLLALAVVGWQQWGMAPGGALPGRLLRQRWLWFAVGAVILIALPVVPAALERFQAGRQIDFYAVPLGKIINNGLSAFSVGMSRSLVHPAWQVTLIVVGAVVGLIIIWRRSRLVVILLLAYQIVPIGLMLLLSLINPLYNGTRHLLIGLPPFLVALAVGMGGGNLTGIPKPARFIGWGMRLLLILFTLGSQLQLLWAQFHAPELVRDDVRGAAEYLSEFAAKEDVIVLHDTLIRFTFDYYYDGPARVVALPQYAHMNQTEAIKALAAVGEGATRVWFLTEPLPRTGFPRDLLTKWAADHWQLVETRSFAWMWLRVGLQLYVAQPIGEQVPATAAVQSITWDGQLHLQGVEAPTTAVSGGDWYLAFYWMQTEARRDYQLSLRFVDEAGQLWSETGWRLRPYSQPGKWPAGQIVREDRRVSLQVGLPPGAYQVWLRLIDARTHEPVLANDNELDVHLLELLVQADPAADAANLPEHTPSGARWPDVALVGFNLETAEYRPGHLLPVVVFWQVFDEIPTDYEWIVQLLDPERQLAAEAISTPTRATYPPTEWRPGEILQGQTQLTVPSWAGEGEYTVQVGWRDPQTGRFVRQRWWRAPLVTLGTVPVKPWALQTELPPIPSPLAVSFGEPVLANLAGFDLAETAVTPGSVLPLTLFWQAQQEMTTNYQVFIHLTTADDVILAQRDILPVNGARPTTSWRTAEVLVDAHELWVGPEVPAGVYELWVGLYEATTGIRLPVFEEGAALPDGRYLLGMITVGDE